LQVIQYLSESKYFKISYLLTTIHIHICSFSVHVIKQSATTDMAAMLYDLNYNDGTHYNTGRLEVRQDIGEFQYYRMRNSEVIYQHFYVHAGSMLK
jgi:hypothetical protein